MSSPVPSRLTPSMWAMLIMAASGCDDGTGPVNEGRAHYQFSLVAVGGDSTSERSRLYECLVFGFFDRPMPVPVSATVRFPVEIRRRMQEQRGRHLEFTEADTAIGEAVLVYGGLGGARLEAAFAAGNYETTLAPGSLAVTPPTEYSGDWSCGPEAPLSQESTLVAYGYDSLLRIGGTWRISEMEAFE